MEGSIDRSIEKHPNSHPLSQSTAQRYSLSIPAQTTNKNTHSEGGAARPQRATRQPRPQTLSIATASFLENATAKVGKMAQTVTHTSPAKIKSALIGNKKRVLEVECTTTPTPQSYTSGDQGTGRPQSTNPHTQWDEDINFSGEEDIGEDDQYSMKTDYTGNLADHLMNKDEKISNLYNSLLEP